MRNLNHRVYSLINIKQSGPPSNGAIVIVSGGTAQYRDGEWYSGMESPLFSRPILWEVTHYMRIPVFSDYETIKGPYDVDATHTDKGEQETATCLKYRQRARDAEAALKVEHDQRVIMQGTLEVTAGDTKDYAITSYGAIYGVTKLAAIETLKSCKAIRDKQLEDVLMPEKGDK